MPKICLYVIEIIVKDELKTIFYLYRYEII